MAQWGVELILANSPQAKGRVERMNGVLQDRLVKALRLAGISDLESANRFLEETYLGEFNRRFGRVAASPLDAQRGIPRNLDEVLSWEEPRVVQRDWTVAEPLQTRFMVFKFHGVQTTQVADYLQTRLSTRQWRGGRNRRGWKMED
jgi:hypothetical protein